MGNKFKISIIIAMIGIAIYGQTSHIMVVKDSTKIDIIGNSVFRIHQEIYVKKDSGWARSDSTRIRFTKVTLPNILFKQSKTEILPESLLELERMYTMLKDNPKTRLQINGYSDKIGDSTSNLELSIIRAKIIKVNLMEKGIKADRMVTNGFGDKILVCQSPCKKNQRVEFVLTKI